MDKKAYKRLICRLSLGLVHWEGRTDGGGLGDAIQCPNCGADHYGPGWVIHDKSKEPKHLPDVEVLPLFLKTPPRDGVIQYFRYGFRLLCVERFRIVNAQNSDVPGNLIGIRVWFLSMFIMFRK